MAEDAAGGDVWDVPEHHAEIYFRVHCVWNGRMREVQRSVGDGSRYLYSIMFCSILFYGVGIFPSPPPPPPPPVRVVVEIGIGGIMYV